MELSLITNRSADPRDPLLSQLDSESMLLMPRAGEGSPRTKRGQARRRWAAEIGGSEPELLELLEVLRFDVGFSWPRFHRSIAAQMGAIGLPHEKKDVQVRPGLPSRSGRAAGNSTS